MAEWVAIGRHRRNWGEKSQQPATRFAKRFGSRVAKCLSWLAKGEGERVKDTQGESTKHLVALSPKLNMRQSDGKEAQN